MEPLAPETLQTPIPLAESTANTTVFPDPPPVAVSVTDVPMTPSVGGVKLIVWGVDPEDPG